MRLVNTKSGSRTCDCFGRTDPMTKFRKKPVVVDAEQFFPDRKPHPEGVQEYVKSSCEDVLGDINTWFGWRIDTLEGPHEVTPGDWIITGVKGEKYPCKPENFKKMYEIVDEDEAQ